MWYKCCENIEVIETLYSTNPDLSSIALHEVRLQWDGSLLKLRFDLPVFPDRTPARWAEEFTVAQAVVDLWEVTNLSINGWVTSNLGKLKIDRLSDKLLLVEFESPMSHIRCQSSLARITTIKGYAVEDV